MTTLKIEIGTKLNMKLNAVKTFGNSENNPIVSWEIATIEYYDGDQVDYVTFKGKKTEYRFGGNRIYSITGPAKEFIICG